MNAGEVSAAPRKNVPANLPTGSAIADSLGGGTGSGALPDWLRRLLQRLPAWRWWLLIASIVLALLCLLIPVVGIVLAVLVVIGGLLLRRWLDAQLARPPAGGGPASVVDDETWTPAAVDGLPTSSSFTLPPPPAPSGTLPAPLRAVPGPDGTDLEAGPREAEVLTALDTQP